MSWPEVNHELWEAGTPRGLVISFEHYNNRFYVKIARRSDGEEEIVQQITEGQFDYPIFNLNNTASTYKGQAGVYKLRFPIFTHRYWFEFDVPEKKPGTWYAPEAVSMSSVQAYRNEIELGNLP